MYGLTKSEPKRKNFKLNKNVVNHYMRYPLLLLKKFCYPVQRMGIQLVNYDGMSPQVIDQSVRGT